MPSLFLFVLLLLVLVMGLAPLALGLAVSRPGGRLGVTAASVLTCALAFNLTFFWQELWLVLPKSMAGLHPTLFHNDHDWTVRAPIAELLQGTGALATLASGLAFLALLQFGRLSPGWRLFAFWMAAQGLFQALSQLAIGTQLPGNDVGRALAFLGAPWAATIVLLALAMAGMGAAGRALARVSPLPLGWRGAAVGLLATAALAVLLVIPFRLPRSLIEVALIPAIVNLMIVGWLTLGAAQVKPEAPEPAPVDWKWPALALLVLLAIFQLVLRPGIAL